MSSPFELIDRAMWLANGQDNPHSATITELCEALGVAVRHYAAAFDAMEFAHDEGFQWPADPLCEQAFVFADTDGADARLASAIEARRAAAVKQGAVQERAVGEAETPETPHGMH